jgi:dTDP-4-amino-4,6-dideoxygalactose transaminase
MQIAAPYFDEREIELVRECLASGWVTQGPMTDKFEKAVARLHGVEHALATTSCSAALHLATLALGLGPGDEVIVPAFTWITSANCAEYVGARVVFADIDPDTYNLDPVAFEAAITPRTRAVVAVHLFGLAADMDPILAIAARHGIHVIEDAACAIGTTYKGRPIGGLGAIGCFSFHPRKVVTTGEGGMVTTNGAALAARVQSFRNHGSTGVAPAEQADARKPWTMATFNLLGYNLRLSDIQAAVGLAQMEKLKSLLAERRQAALRYGEMLKDVNGLSLPRAGDTSGHTYQSYVIRVMEGGRERRNAIMRHLDDAKIQTRPGTHAVHNLGYYKNKYSLKPGDFPAASNAEITTITLPIFPGIKVQDQELVVSKIQDVLRRGISRSC